MLGAGRVKPLLSLSAVVAMTFQSCRQALWAPYTWKFSFHTRRISVLSRSSRWSRAEGW